MRQDLQNDPGVQTGGLAARFANFVTQKVENVLRHTIKYPIEDIESVVYQDGGLVFTYRKKQTLSFEKVNMNGKPALKSFPETDARLFVQHCTEAKYRQSQCS